MKRRLLLDSDVVEYLQTVPVRERARLWNRLREIADTPDRFEDYQERDARGRDLSGHICYGHSILFWDDFADRHLKILEIAKADHLPG